MLNDRVWHPDPLEIDFDTLEGGSITTFDTLPGLKLIPRYGVLLWWSDRIPTWVHADDIETAQRLVPGKRVFRRVACTNTSDQTLGYAELIYGGESFRALPIVWFEVEPEGFDIGDRVEIKSSYGKRRPGIATITDMIWNVHRQQIEYRLHRRNMPLPRLYRADEIHHAPRLS